MRSGGGAAVRASPRSSREGYFLSSQTEKQRSVGGGEEPVAATRPMTRPAAPQAGFECGVSASESSYEGPHPHVGSELQTTTRGL